MPAGSDVPPLPHTFRPFGVRLAVYVFGAFLLVVAAVVWFAFPADVRARFDVLQRLTLLGFGIGGAVAGHALARCRVRVTDDEVEVVNGYRTHRYHWNQVVGVSLRPGSPWAVLDLADGTTVAAMGIQGSDGARAVGQARALRRLVLLKTTPEQDD